MTDTYGIYARVSTTDQLDGMSIEAQLKALHEWCQAHGFAAREFVDAGKSAWTEDLRKRPAFLQMIDAIRAREVVGAAVTHLDRFSRKVLVTLSVLGEFGKLGAGFVSLENAAFDFTRPADRLLLTVLGAFAEYYSAELSRKIRRGLATRASKGLSLGVLEFGYCNGACLECKTKDPPCSNWGKTGGAIIAHTNDAPAVPLAFESYRARDKSFNDVADMLNRAGYRSRTRNGRVLFNKHSIDEMLGNLSYTGVVDYQGKEIPGQHPALISRELFDEVQAIRAARRTQRLVSNKRHTIYLLAGLLRCAGCGRPMRVQYHKKNGAVYLYYRCRTNESRRGVCHLAGAWINENEIAPQIADVVRRFVLPDNWLEQLQVLLTENGKAATGNGESRERLRDKLARLADLYELGDMPKAEYLTKRDDLRTRLARTRKPETISLAAAANTLRTMRDAWDWANQEERRDMLRAILEEVICDPSRRTIIALKPKESFRLLFRQIGLQEENGLFKIAQA